jgi:multiple sugar transport system permease protein
VNRNAAPDTASSVSPTIGMTYARRRKVFLVLMTVPAVAYVIAIGVWPLARGIAFSLYDFNLLKPARTHFVGFGNYADLLVDPVTQRAFFNTALFTIVAVAVELLLGFAIALALWRDDRFNRICLALILVPVTITPLVVGLIFRALLMPEYGLIGYYLAELGLSGRHGVFAEGPSALATLIFIDIWEWTPLVALILLAGLKALPSDILEAARVDGASATQRLTMVIAPLMAPTVILALTLRTIDAFRVFDIVYVSTGGGPGDSTNTLMLHAVKQGLEFFNIGRASAISNLTLACIALIATGFILLFRQADRRAHGV